MSVGNNITAAVSKSDAGSGGDALKKSTEVLQKLLVPHWAEDTKDKAKRAREILTKEVSKGPLKIKVLGKDKKRKRR